MSQTTETVGEKIENGMTAAAEVAELAGFATGNPEVTALAKAVQDIAGKVETAVATARTASATAQAAVSTAQTAHAKANDALDQLAAPAPPSAHESLLQEIVDFLHRLFPFHAVPGISTTARTTAEAQAALDAANKPA